MVICTSLGLIEYNLHRCINMSHGTHRKWFYATIDILLEFTQTCSCRNDGVTDTVAAVAARLTYFHNWPPHYNDVIMGAMASHITSLTIVYSPVYSGADQRKHQSSASLPFVWGIHRWPVNSPHKGPVTRKMLPFDDVIMFYSYMSTVRCVPLSILPYTCVCMVSNLQPQATLCITVALSKLLIDCEFTLAQGQK